MIPLILLLLVFKLCFNELLVFELFLRHCPLDRPPAPKLLSFSAFFLLTNFKYQIFLVSMVI